MKRLEFHPSLTPSYRTSIRARVGDARRIGLSQRRASPRARRRSPRGVREWASRSQPRSSGCEFIPRSLLGCFAPNFFAKPRLCGIALTTPLARFPPLRTLDAGQNGSSRSAGPSSASRFPIAIPAARSASRAVGCLLHEARGPRRNLTREAVGDYLLAQRVVRLSGSSRIRRAALAARIDSGALLAIVRDSSRRTPHSLAATI